LKKHELSSLTSKRS